MLRIKLIHINKMIHRRGRLYIYCCDTKRKRSRHSWRMRNPQFYVSGKMPIPYGHNELFTYMVNNARLWCFSIRWQTTGHHPGGHYCDYCYCALCISYYYNNAIMGAMASQITSLTIVYSVVYSCVDQRKHQSSASLAFDRRIPGTNGQ